MKKMILILVALLSMTSGAFAQTTSGAFAQTTSEEVILNKTYESILDEIYRLEWNIYIYVNVREKNEVYTTILTERLEKDVQVLEFYKKGLKKVEAAFEELEDLETAKNPERLKQFKEKVFLLGLAYGEKE